MWNAGYQTVLCIIGVTLNCLQTTGALNDMPLVCAHVSCGVYSSIQTEPRAANKEADSNDDPIFFRQAASIWQAGSEGKHETLLQTSFTHCFTHCLTHCIRHCLRHCFTHSLRQPLKIAPPQRLPTLGVCGCVSLDET
mmetsp:Transcript_19711/g.28954  ORF Transcript_19711/g.28954 Transcript_19711/m.28954 type:complete len:138 (+) Transcript_19711:2546-2959(+)